MSGHEHLSEDALLDAVYGIAGSEAEAHLRGCADCAQRLHEWHEKRAAAAESVEISGEFLAAQRRKIYERIERPSRKHWLWAPGLAAACALAVGVFVYHPVLIRRRQSHRTACGDQRRAIVRRYLFHGAVAGTGGRGSGAGAV